MNKIINIGKILLVILSFAFDFLVLGLIAYPAFAQTQTYEEEDSVKPSFTIAPAIFEIDTNRNERFAEAITIENHIETPIPVQVVIKDYAVDENGVPDYGDLDTDWSPKKWIKPVPSEFIIEGNASRNIVLKIRIPPHAESGSHFAAIMFEPVMPEDYFIPGSAHVIPHIGAVMALNVDHEAIGTPDVLYEIGEFRAYNLVENDNIDYSSFLTNNDVFYHKVAGDIVIINVLNKEVARFEIPQTTLFPQKRRFINGSEAGDLSFGRYKAKIVVGDEQEVVEDLASFWVYPSFGTTLILVLVGILILVLVIFRKRLLNIGKLLRKKGR